MNDKIKKRLVEAVNKLEGAKTCLKFIHWNAPSLTEHRLCDDVHKELSEFQDNVAEIFQVIVNERLTLKDMNPQYPSVNTLYDFLIVVCDDCQEDAAILRAQNDLDLIGIISEYEGFVAKLQKFIYQCSLLLK